MIFTIFPTKSSWIIFHNLLQGFVYYKDYRLNLITNKKEDFTFFKLKKRLQSYKICHHYQNPLVLILFYEFNSPSASASASDINKDLPYAIELEYNNSNILNEKFLHKNSDSDKEDKLYIHRSDNLSFREYLSAFEKGYQELLKGNCYQFNLTFEHKFKILSPSSEPLITYILKHILSNTEACAHGAYANITNIPILNKIYLSNSPECLFKIKKTTKNRQQQLSIFSMPIKGSLKLSNNKKISALKKELSDCKKNSGELNMITDLIRNDLSSIENKKSTVVTKKAYLKVPNILHQYSVVKVDISNPHLNLFQIIEKIFPGGSITGAPKKRVMKIISEIEPTARGFYTGSTIIFHKTLKAASINIRSATISSSTAEFTYGSGGGITLLSNPFEEFEEMNLKVKSFIDYLFS
ncbi:MAG: chorismate-binding protein [Oligoflexia bacterium]|nr:chorismate-binding protein [Oligoflexia bacterium]